MRSSRRTGNYKGFEFRVEATGIVALTPIQNGVNFSDLTSFKEAVNEEISNRDLPKYKLGDTVEILEDEIESSDDEELLESLLGKILTVQGVYRNNEMVHYVLSYENNIIKFDEDTPFKFIDADLKAV